MPRQGATQPTTGATDEQLARTPVACPPAAVLRVAAVLPIAAVLPVAAVLGWALALGACGGSAPVPSAEAPPPARSPKRGVAYHFCGWDVSRGRGDLDAMKADLSWTYNWSDRPLACADGHGVGDALVAANVEFVPMIWGLVDGGAGCASGGPCFRVDNHGGGEACDAACAREDGRRSGSGAPGDPCYECSHRAISREELAAGIPDGARFLLAFNEPNFREQAHLSPDEAARAFAHVEWVADQRGLAIVGPATNFCDADATEGPAACIPPVDGHAMMHLAWLERFYDACSASGVAGHDCRIDHQATHAYACHSIHWAITLMKAKAGLVPSGEAHCADGAQNEDETGVDCGGVACVACSARAREIFAKPVWLTEFANAPWGGCEAFDTDAMRERALAFVDAELAALEADPQVFRYAWFMPKAKGALDHADLLVEGGDGERTPLGERYFGAPF